ncbi:hypothetical protein D9756_004821 [Leucocoprinus leucothites]|uniref:Uncharacterized protein n=1 Tax=Leucocoprinus leucothites TaxID=201217 RepID=A0A8H5G945_9AGAR|nr:hypothetical protein D9756_004821 [Leucoagaricus leucothites]
MGSVSPRAEREMPPNLLFTSYFNTVVETLGLLLYTPLVQDETSSIPPTVQMEALAPRRETSSVNGEQPRSCPSLRGSADSVDTR